MFRGDIVGGGFIILEKLDTANRDDVMLQKRNRLIALITVIN